VSFTVVPLHNLKLPAGTRIPFGGGFFLQDVPEWVRQDQQILNGLGRQERESLLEARHALVAEYKAAAIGEEDPEWKGKEPKSIQSLRSDIANLASMAIWLRQPSSVCFTIILHAVSWHVPGYDDMIPIIQSVERQLPLYCHPKDIQSPFTTLHATKAGKLHVALCAVPRNNSVWEATRSFWAALTSYTADRRYPGFWIGLESLFGSNDSNEIAYKLCQRIAFFIADNPADARAIFRKAKVCYRTRSKIIHGRWENDPGIDAVMGDTEAMVRTAFRFLLQNPDMVTAFISKSRDEFLEDWVFSRYMDPPPFPIP